MKITVKFSTPRAYLAANGLVSIDIDGWKVRERYQDKDNWADVFVMEPEQPNDVVVIDFTAR